MWVQNQRNSWHGVDFAYNSDLDMAEYYRRYWETLFAVDDSVGRVLAVLCERGQLEDTLVVYIGDNGFAFGEHGLIDKRTAYQWSMRMPLLMQCPAVLKGGSVVTQLVANIDIAPHVHPHPTGPWRLPKPPARRRRERAEFAPELLRKKSKQD